MQILVKEYHSFSIEQSKISKSWYIPITEASQSYDNIYFLIIWFSSEFMEVTYTFCTNSYSLCFPVCNVYNILYLV